MVYFYSIKTSILQQLKLTLLPRVELARVVFYSENTTPHHYHTTTTTQCLITISLVSTSIQFSKEK